MSTRERSGLCGVSGTSNFAQVSVGACVVFLGGEGAQMICCKAHFGAVLRWWFRADFMRYVFAFRCDGPPSSPICLAAAAPTTLVCHAAPRMTRAPLPYQTSDTTTKVSSGRSHTAGGRAQAAHARHETRSRG